MKVTLSPVVGIVRGTSHRLPLRLPESAAEMERDYLSRAAERSRQRKAEAIARQGKQVPVKSSVAAETALEKFNRLSANPAQAEEASQFYKAHKDEILRATTVAGR